MPRVSYSSVIHVTVGGSPLPSPLLPLLTGAWVDLGAGVPGAFQLTFRDPKRQLLRRAGIKLGTRIKLAPIADGKGAQDPLITGEVTGLETDYDGTGTFTVVRGYDLGHRMLRQRRVTGYAKMTAAAIVRKLVKESGIGIGKIEPTKGAYDFITQDNITDWDFLSRLADENERIMFLDEKGKFQFVSPDRASGAPPESTPGDRSPYVLQAGTDILRCRAAVTAADQVPQVEARGWDVKAKKPLTAKAPATSNPGFGIGITPGKAAKAFKASTLVETATPYDEQTQVKRAADSLADDVTASFAELEVTVRGAPKLRPDLPVTLTDVGEPFEGKYTATAVRHVFESGRHYETWVTVSGRQWRSLYGVASGGTSASPRLPSVANAVVTDVKDPLKQGRVKLQFPWLDDTYVSDWTRTVQLGGVEGGSIVPLDVKDEVLVAFDRGALDHPYVIGGLYNGKDKPDVNDVPLHDRISGKASRHTVADRENNRLDLLSQKTGRRKRGVRLRTGDNRLTVELDRTKTEITVDSAGTVSIKGAGMVSVDAGADLSLKAGGVMNLTAGGAMSLTAGGAMSVKGGAELGLTAGGIFNLNAAGAGMIDVGGMLQMAAGAEANLMAGAALQILAPGNVAIGGAEVALVGYVTADGIPVI
ncbi:VgrG-related protein [Streptomyces pinistramenti]|uniref:VgrG-related protein n=1 Tax=Streptomyces pinistramenti TaxID=2884812 RepID=UPI001D09963E|nr:VgrG-related protein [Streptomyces pinistramenti]MCB5909121.1 VgrG-related protein [Streptomyces pinistramenti]